MIHLLTASIFMASLMAEPSPCYEVIDRARALSEPDQQLSLLGGCLASPNNVWVHLPVVIEMASIANDNGMTENVARYLDVMKLMIEGIHIDPHETKPEQ